LLETKGAASAQGFGLTLQQAAPVYIEDVFSTWLYTGNGSTQTITNGIDLSTKGGLVWIKSRSAGYGHYIFDTNRGALNRLASNGTGAQSSISNSLTSFLSNGFSLGSEVGVNESPGNYASWTFRKQPKFFDVVTYTGNGTAGRTISHSLGSVPGCIIIKKTSDTENWGVYHRSLGNTQSLALNLTNAAGAGFWNSTTPTSTVFTVGNQGQVNDNGQTYVAYLFAHNAGGFGLTGTDNVISCGSFTTDGSGIATVTLGYEPQWVLIKNSGGADQWFLMDSMRGFTTDRTDAVVYPNTAGAEVSRTIAGPTSTGFSVLEAPSNSFIYIAIRRGPMRTPTTGTSVFSPVARSGTGAATNITSPGFPPDLVFDKNRGSGGWNWNWFDRLRGAPILSSDNTAAEVSVSTIVQADWSSTTMLGYRIQNGSEINASGNTYSDYALRRATGFFDVVCYTGTGSATTQAHNLGVVPEMMIVKRRSSSGSDWWVYNSNLGNTKSLRFTDESAFTLLNIWNNTSPTSSVFTVGGDSAVNGSGSTYVAYLFATVSGVSKVGSYTGTGALQTINCGFTGGARFVLIKRTDSTGDWWVYDSARGISSGNDPYLFLNSTAAEVTGTNYVDTTSVGFQVTAAAPAGLNANGGTYIFLAVA
jgi:hypothetical protein